jgi:hypothetical protein
MMNEDWKLLTSFFPENWKELAATTNALKGLRKNKSAENMLRTLLIHLACGCSLRETAVRAKKACLSDLSAVALWKRLRKSKEWLYSLCLALFEQQGIECSRQGGFQVRLFDATTVKEPGKTGGLWRIHYSVRLPSLSCDFFNLAQTHGQGTGESLLRFPIRPRDYIIADRVYSTARGIHYAQSQGAYVAIRLNPQSLPLRDLANMDFSLLKVLKSIRKPGQTKSWPVMIADGDGGFVEGRLCAVRKTQEAVRMAEKKLMQRASKKGHELKPTTFIYAKYVMVFTTFPKSEFSEFDVLEWYRIRWQIELVFKRFKQIASLGHLPKNDEESAMAWLYGKLFVALLSEKLIEYAQSISPWGYDLAQFEAAKSMA